MPVMSTATSPWFRAIGNPDRRASDSTVSYHPEKEHTVPASRARRAFAVTALAAAAVVAIAGPAAAHVTISPSGAAAGSYTVLTFSVPHGCDGSPTNVVTITMPPEIHSVTPTVLAGWTVAKEKEPLATPVQSGHGTVSERVKAVVYTSTTGGLPADLRAAFELSLQVPESAAGETLAFPTVQTCAQGSAAWTELAAPGQDPHDLAKPAPLLEATAAEGDGHGGDAGDDHAGDDATAGAALASSTSGGDGGSSDALAVVALVVGAVGAVLGGLGLAAARRARTA